MATIPRLHQRRQLHHQNTHHAANEKKDNLKPPHNTHKNTTTSTSPQTPTQIGHKQTIQQPTKPYPTSNKHSRHSPPRTLRNTLKYNPKTIPHTALTPQETQFSFTRKLLTSHLENTKAPTTYTPALMDFTNSLTSTTPHRYYPNPT